MSPHKRRISLVVDASVGRAASEEAVDSGAHCGHPCREALKAIRNHEQLEMAFSPRLWEEWKRNQSRFSHKWLTQMYARKKVHRLPEETNRHDGVEKAAASTLTPRQANAVTKDSHLIAAALEADLRVISLDETVRGLLVALCDVCADLGRLYWTNPCNAPQTGPSCAVWLENGAPREEPLKLCP